jgi:hypothetical protein
MITDETIAITAILVAALLAVPHRYLLVPYLVAACFVPADQRIIILGLDFTVLRILIAFGVLRICLRGERRAIRLTRFDYLVLSWAAVGACIYVIQWLDAKAFINRCGILFDVFGLYWLFRQSIRSWADVRFVFRVLAVCAVALLPFVAWEWATGHNPFSFIGRAGTEVRRGHYRCQATFSHSIMMGLFWANLVPVFFGLAIAEGRKILYGSACAAAIFMVLASNSSTPVGALIGVCLLMGLFSFRCHGRLIAYGLCAATLALHVVMNNPVWHLICRVNVVSGSTGWHRYRLIDGAMKHFGDWALLGARGTAHWGRGLNDITNQYILEAVRGGLVTLVLFVIMLITAVSTLGRYSLRRMPAGQQWLVWSLCVAMLGHCISFMGVSYFGQIMMLLYLMYATVGFTYEISSRPAASEELLAAAVLPA